MVLSQMMRERPRGLLQSCGGKVDRILLSSVDDLFHPQGLIVGSAQDYFPSSMYAVKVRMVRIMVWVKVSVSVNRVT